MGNALPFAISVVSQSLVLAPPAKINLFLELLQKRPDGYHDLETLIVLVNLFDTLELSAQPKPGPISLRCEPKTIPSDSTNLVWRAAEALRQAAGVNFEAQLHLVKRIPHQAGLGGGSSDAAMTLLGLNHLWRLNWSVDQLRDVAARIGSDVGVFLTPPAGWCTGRGEQVEPEFVGQTLHLVIVKPPFGLSTPRVYQLARVSAEPLSGEQARLALRQGDVAAIARHLHNRLQEAAIEAEPQVRTILQQLSACGPLGVLLSGSGSCVLALCADSRSAHSVAKRFRQLAGPSFTVWVVQSVTPMAL